MNPDSGAHFFISLWLFQLICIVASFSRPAHRTETHKQVASLHSLACSVLKSNKVSLLQPPSENYWVKNEVRICIPRWRMDHSSLPLALLLCKSRTWSSHAMIPHLTQRTRRFFVPQSNRSIPPQQKMPPQLNGSPCKRLQLQLPLPPSLLQPRN